LERNKSGGVRRRTSRGTPCSAATVAFRATSTAGGGARNKSNKNDKAKPVVVVVARYCRHRAEPRRNAPILKIIPCVGQSAAHVPVIILYLPARTFGPVPGAQCFRRTHTARVLIDHLLAPATRTECVRRGRSARDFPPFVSRVRDYYAPSGRTTYRHRPDSVTAKYIPNTAYNGQQMLQKPIVRVQ